MHMKRNCFCLIVLLIVLGVLCTACSVTESEGQSATSAVYEDVSDILQNADTLFRSGEYVQSLDQYLKAMEKNPKDMDSRIGVVNCQIGLGNYKIAEINLSMAKQINPSAIEICEMYLKLYQETGSAHYANIALDLSALYKHEEILANVPSTPTIDQEPGNYSEKIMLTISCDDPDAEVYVNLKNSLNQNCNLNGVKYSEPILLLRGENTVSVYSQKNGLPSETVTQVYSVDYESYNVTFQEPLIEELVRQAIGKTSGSITNYDCETVTDLDWYSLESVYNNYNTFQNLRIHSLEDLKHFPCLEYITLEYQTEIEDYSPLQYCPNLYRISLYECKLADTEFLRYLPQLAYLYLQHTDISDFSGLEDLTDLHGLSIYGDNSGYFVDNILRNNKQIQSLSIGDNQLEDYSILLEMDNLYDLYLYGVSYVDYSVIGQLTNLEYLEISYNYNRREYNKNIGDISFLPQMQNLQYLYLNGVNNVSDLEYIKQIPNITKLFLYNCDVTNDFASMNALSQTLPYCSISY